MTDKMKIYWRSCSFLIALAIGWLIGMGAK